MILYVINNYSTTSILQKSSSSSLLLILLRLLVQSSHSFIHSHIIIGIIGGYGGTGTVRVFYTILPGLIKYVQVLSGTEVLIPSTGTVRTPLLS